MNVAFFEFSPDVEDDGGVITIAESGGVVFVLLGEDLDVAFFGEFEFGGWIGVVFPVGDDFCDLGTDALDLLEGGVGLLEGVGGGAEARDEAADFDGAGFGELVEGDEGFGFGHG